ncbi:hypothetical protein [Lentzea sp. HUAS12]|uniref:hypothetical protein n=1 Tax=Lentzea sp. HUAS12 TaxID=2951806 RepID=UPI00209D78D2|nr:hypothetical protein [Lentzea sp. HUAS12]USX56302.1 hypothetical protein ND450_20025 [Lentzea sp. HUAS12]
MRKNLAKATAIIATATATLGLAAFVAAPAANAQFCATDATTFKSRCTPDLFIREYASDTASGRVSRSYGLSVNSTYDCLRNGSYSANPRYSVTTKSNVQNGEWGIYGSTVGDCGIPVNTDFCSFRSPLNAREIYVTLHEPGIPCEVAYYYA